MEKEVRAHRAAQVAQLWHHAGAQECAGDVARIARPRGGQRRELGACVCNVRFGVGGVLHFGEHGCCHPVVSANNRAQDLHASAEPHDVRRQRRGIAPKEAAALDGVVIIAVLQGGQQTAAMPVLPPPALACDRLLNFTFSSSGHTTTPPRILQPRGPDPPGGDRPDPPQVFLLETPDGGSAAQGE
jgi:hypothetical protein